MESSAEKLFENMNRLYQNIYNLSIGFQQATTSNSPIQVQILNENNQQEIITVNSFQQIANELSRINNNFVELTNDKGYIVNGDGALTTIQKVTFLNAEYLSNITINENLLVDNLSPLRNMMFPAVKLPLILDSKIKSDVRAKIYEISEGWESIEDNITMLNLDYHIQRGAVIGNQEEMVLSIEKQRVKYFGKFSVINASPINNNKQTIEIDKITYTGLNTLSQNLQVGDILATDTARYQIETINNFTKQLQVLRVAGSTAITTGIDKLMFNEILSVDSENTVGLPIQPNKKLIVFLSTQNNHYISYPSVGLKIDTSTYSVTYENQTLTLDEFFNYHVTNVSEYLYSIIRDTTIPFSLGVKPTVPVLRQSNFKVIQINKHLTDAKATKDIEKLNQEKQKIQNDIEYTQTEITSINNDIETLRFKSADEKNLRIANVKQLREKLNVLNSQLLTVTRNLNNNAIQYGLKATKPKYKIIGVWDIQKPIFSPLTVPQNIIKYDVQYRYLSKNVDTVDSTSYKMINDEGKEVAVVFSPWNTLETTVLNKVQNVDGTISWGTTILDNIDDVNINQLNISISEGESVEIRVRSISEAGYPLSPMKSDWSEILKVDFPESLTEGSLNSIVSKNEEDLKKSEFNEILQTSGILDYVSKQIRESEKTYLCSAADIASGFYSEEMKIIPVDVMLQKLSNKIDTLLNTETTSKVKVEIIDFNNETYQVVNNSTLELDAGNYADNINLLDSTKFGSIIRKQGFIRISNKNTLPIEVKSLVPGVEFSSNNAPKYYNVPMKTPDELKQRSKQIIYFRNIDITGQTEDVFRLIKERLSNTDTFPNPIYLDTTAIEDSKNIIFYNFDTQQFGTGKLLPNAGTDFICFTTEHPLYDSENLEPLVNEFKRIRKYTSTLKAEKYQDEPFIDGELIYDGLGFEDNDTYAIGENSCGAFLYPIVSNPVAISVLGNNTISTLVIPENSEILIPFVYEYRMLDRLGKVNGMNDVSVTDSLVYSKKIGIDILINLETFRFDINVTSKLRATIVPIESLNVSSVVSRFGNVDNDEII